MAKGCGWMELPTDALLFFSLCFYVRVCVVYGVLAQFELYLLNVFISAATVGLIVFTFNFIF